MLKITKNKGLSIKDVRSRGFFRCGRPHFLVQKNSGFFEIYGVSKRTRGRGCQFFAISCGRLLWTVPNQSSEKINYWLIRSKYSNSPNISWSYSNAKS